MAAILWTIICVTAMVCAAIMWVKTPDFEIEFYDHPSDRKKSDTPEGMSTLDELAKSQNVHPVTDVESLLGGWPGDVNDGFEEEILRIRGHSN